MTFIIFFVILDQLPQRHNACQSMKESKGLAIIAGNLSAAFAHIPQKMNRSDVHCCTLL